MQDAEDIKDNNNLKLETLIFNNILNTEAWFKFNPYERHVHLEKCIIPF